MTITEEEQDELMQDELEPEVINRVIYVGNLSYNATKEDLKKLFEGFGFVEMESISDAKVAKDTLDGRSFRGKNLHLGWGTKS